MKIKNLKLGLAVLTVVGLASWGTNGLAQDTATVAAPAASASVPQLAYGVPQILQLTQAKVVEATVMAYIKNSGNSYDLNADQIIYLRQQGVSDAVIQTMLNQPKPGSMAGDSAPAPQPTAATTTTATEVPTATVAPTVTYVQTVPTTYYYYGQPYYYPAYGYYGWYPGVSVSLGWGGGWHGGWHGGGWHGHH